MRKCIFIAALVAALAGQGMAPVAITAAVPAAVSPATVIPSGFAGIDRIVVIVLENHSYSSIVNNPAAPYLNSLIRSYGLATNYTGIAHPSQANYVALFSGSTYGIADDGFHTLSGTTLADQLEAHGKTWRIAAENVPSGCFNGASAYGGSDGPGWYARKHEPAIMFKSIATNRLRCARITDLRHFSLTAANFQLVVPNMCHDMHDCSVATGDAFLARFMAPITRSAAFARTLVVVTFDEGFGGDGAGGGGRVATVLVGPMVRRGARSSVAHNHYSLLRTVENAWGLGCLVRSCAANDLRELLGS